jgi:type I restriction enzyme S subunit
LTTEYYTDAGPWLLRGVEYSNGVIDFDALVSISREKYEEQPQIHLREGDVALTKDGTIGRALAIPELPNEMAAGSTVARIRPKGNDPIDPYFLEFALNHPAIQTQIQSFATGMAQPHITQEWIVQLMIPRGEFEAEVARLVREHHTYIQFATSLIIGAQVLVEGLIDGTIKEAEMEQAQRDLERQDRKADRNILSRISRTGIDTEDYLRLFPDVDALYIAIDEIQRINTHGEAS